MFQSVCQTFEDRFLPFIKPVVETHVLDQTDRHKVRAGYELLSGLLRGAKHWPISKSTSLMAWVEDLLPKAVKAVRTETQPAAEMAVSSGLVYTD